MHGLEYQTVPPVVLSSRKGSTMKDGLVLVAGGGGFIGGHLVANLLSQGYRVRSVDVKPMDDWYQVFDQVDNRQLDLRLKGDCEEAVQGASEVYNLAADMGGMGFIEN